MRFLFSFFWFLAFLSHLAGEASHFPFSDHPIDVVIPCIEKDLVTLHLCIQGIKENGTNIRRVIVVSRKKLTEEAEWFSEEAYPFSLQEVAAALPDDSPKERLLRIHPRANWYYQQLLKLYSLLVIPDISPNVLILDADTIFLSPVTFLNEHNGGMYNPSIEYHPPYFQHAARLIPGFYKYFPEYSGISHHMIFQKPVIEALFNEVESLHGEPFWKAFCHCVALCDFSESGASEYEIYFNYLFSHTLQPSIRQLKWANIERISTIPLYKKQGFHYVSIHTYCRIAE